MEKEPSKKKKKVQFWYQENLAVDQRSKILSGILGHQVSFGTIPNVRCNVVLQSLY